MRIFQKVFLSENSNIQLDEAAAHHLTRVLRAKIKDKVKIFNGEGGEYEATILSITKKETVLHLEKFISNDRESPLEICLVQGISRGEKMDYTIQKAVELGVKKIIPVLTERCTIKLDEERRERRLQHWQSIIIHACEQCGRTKIPELSSPMALDDWLQIKPSFEMAFVLSPDANRKKCDTALKKPTQLALLIGPEGGLTSEEIKKAEKAEFELMSLGPRILRTETAAVTALSVFQYLWGDV